MPNKTYRFKGGEKRSTSPLVVRVSAKTRTRVHLDGVDKGPYSAATGVRMTVAGSSGSATGSALPELTFKYGATYTEVTFTGLATWSVNGSFLEVVSDGTLTVTEGGSALPVTQGELQAASVIEIGSPFAADEGPVPHKP